MYIFTVEEAQKDLAHVLDLVARGKDVAIGGDKPVILLRMKSVRNLKPGNPESCGTLIVGHVEDSVLDDEAVKPLPPEVIESFYKPRIYDTPAAAESR
jgi:hypothetical protein